MNIKRLKAQLVQHEGIRLTPYRCEAGKLTIGIGRNLEDKGISESEAHYLLENDIFEVLLDLAGLFPEFFYFPEEIQIVLTDMRFNLGYDSFREFQDMIGAVKDRDWPSMRAELIDSLWYKEVGRRGPNLVEMVDEVIDDT
ncbi:MAG: hypothetical protein KGY69_13165 [Bacteroidales bacterium]|nr:hypothetical protein [Bacteroidales bacterium]